MKAGIRAGAIALPIALSITQVGGCAWISSWFTKTPRTPAPVTVTLQAPSTDVDLQPASAARAACTNYVQAVQGAPFPRDAVIRGIDRGNATVRFAVDGTTITVLSVRSSDPAFGNAASDVVATLTCRVDRPTNFEVPFDWRTVR